MNTKAPMENPTSALSSFKERSTDAWICIQNCYRGMGKKTILFVTLLFKLCFAAGAQDLSATKALVAQKRWGEARRSIDQALSNAAMRNNPEAWYLKGKVYSAVSCDTASKSNIGDARMQSLSAFQKAVEIDREKTEVYLTKDAYKPLYDLYETGFLQGRSQYRSGRHAQSYSTFDEVGRVGRYIHSQGWGLTPFDTTLTLWRALSASHTGAKDTALALFTRLSDLQVGGKPEYAVVYRWLARDAYERKDDPSFTRHLERGGALYPSDTYLSLIRLDRTLDEGDPGKTIPLYESLLLKHPDSHEITFQYANELFKTTHLQDHEKANRGWGVFNARGGSSSNGVGDYPASVFESKCDRIDALYLRALSMRPGSIEALTESGKNNYNQALLLENMFVRHVKDSIGMTRLMNRVAESKDKAITRLEEVLSRQSKGQWPGAELSEYKSILSMLAYCHEKRDRLKYEEYIGRLEDVEREGKIPSAPQKKGATSSRMP